MPKHAADGQLRRFICHLELPASGTKQLLQSTRQAACAKWQQPVPSSPKNHSDQPKTVEENGAGTDARLITPGGALVYPQRSQAIAPPHSSPWERNIAAKHRCYIHVCDGHTAASGTGCLRSGKSGSMGPIKRSSTGTACSVQCPHACVDPACAFTTMGQVPPGA